MSGITLLSLAGTGSPTAWESPEDLVPRDQAYIFLRELAKRRPGMRLSDILNMVARGKMAGNIFGDLGNWVGSKFSDAGDKIGDWAGSAVRLFDDSKIGDLADEWARDELGLDASPSQNRQLASMMDSLGNILSGNAGGMPPYAWIAMAGFAFIAITMPMRMQSGGRRG